MVWNTNNLRQNEKLNMSIFAQKSIVDGVIVSLRSSLNWFNTKSLISSPKTQVSTDALYIIPICGCVVFFGGCGMTAGFFPLNYKALAKLSSELIKQFSTWFVH